VHEPLGKKIIATFGLIDQGKTAIIEMANASGIRLLKKKELNPLRATSFGTGEQIKLAMSNGASTIVIGMGGSATVDGGSGMLKALGVRFLNDAGNEVANLPEDLIHLASIDTSLIDKRLQNTKVIVLCDVDNLLLGDHGSAAIFGPQKGATTEAVKLLDAALERFSLVALQHTGLDMSAVKYGGTAGGAAAGLYALLNAQLVNGIDHFLELTAFELSLQHCNLVITGEGSIDEQTLQGKGPFGVAKLAKKNGIPVIGLAGKIPLTSNSLLQKYFNVLLPIGNQPGKLSTALANTTDNLKRTAEQLGNLLAVSKK